MSVVKRLLEQYMKDGKKPPQRIKILITKKYGRYKIWNGTKLKVK